MEKIVEALKSCKGKCLDEVLKENDIKVDEFSFDSAYGSILIGKSTFIFLDLHLGRMKEFVTWHEIGHLFMESKGLFCFTNIYDEKELKANVFACLMMGACEEVWIDGGCPPDIASQVDYCISQNVSYFKPFLAYYDKEVV